MTHELPKAIAVRIHGTTSTFEVLERADAHSFYNPKPVGRFTNAERAVAYAAFLSARATEVSGEGYARVIEDPTVEDVIRTHTDSYVLPPDFEAEWERLRDLPYHTFMRRYLHGEISPKMTEWVRRYLTKTTLFDAATSHTFDPTLSIREAGEILSRYQRMMDCTCRGVGVPEGYMPDPDCPQHGHLDL